MPTGQGPRTVDSAAGRAHSAARTVRRATHPLTSPSESARPIAPAGRPGPEITLPIDGEGPPAGPHGHLGGVHDHLGGHARSSLQDARSSLQAARSSLQACTVISTSCTVISAACPIISTSLHGQLYGLHDHPGTPAPSSLQPARSSGGLHRHRCDRSSGPPTATSRPAGGPSAAHANPTGADALCNETIIISRSAPR
jgi:hypothetical protein